MLLTDAINRALLAARNLAIYAIIVEAKDVRAAEFYRTCGFQPFPLDPERLFVTAAKAAAAFGRE